MKLHTDVYDKLYLYITPEKFYVEPIGTKVLLVVDCCLSQLIFDELFKHMYISLKNKFIASLYTSFADYMYIHNFEYIRR